MCYARERGTCRPRASGIISSFEIDRDTFRVGFHVWTNAPNDVVNFSRPVIRDIVIARKMREHARDRRERVARNPRAITREAGRATRAHLINIFNLYINFNYRPNIYLDAYRAQ